MKAESADVSALNQTQREAQTQFDRQSQRYGEGHILANVSDLEAAASSLSLQPSARVLDVATGGGHAALFFASLGYDVTASDVSAVMLELAGKLAARKRLKISTRQHSAEQMPYGDGSFDLVTCRVAPHHFSDVPSFLAEVRRVLVPGGFFLLIDGTGFDWAPEVNAWSNRLEKLRDPSHQRFLTPEEWKAASAAAGLKVFVAEVYEKRQPDLNWYFETAATPAENRREVLRLLEQASDEARRLLKITQEDSRISWQWPMLRLIARRPQT